MWQLINKHTGKLHISNQNIVIKTDSEKILNPQKFAERFHSFFIDGKEDLVQNKPCINGQSSQMKIKYNSNPIFVYPIAAEE